MARFYAPMKNGAGLILNGWDDPRLMQFYDQWVDWVRAEIDRRRAPKPGTLPPAPKPSGPASPNISGGRSGVVGVGSRPPAMGVPGMQDYLDLNIPTISGAQSGFEVGPPDTQLQLPTRDDEFWGVDTSTPDHKLPAGMSPFSINFNTFRVPGSLCVRDGCVKMSEDRDTVAVGGNTIPPGSALGAGYVGLGLAAIPPIDPDATDSCIALLVFSDTEFSSGGLTGNLSLHVVTPFPLGRPTVTGIGRDSPTLTLTPGAPGEVTIQVNALPSAASDPAVQSNSVQAVSVAYSTQNYPSDPNDLQDDRSSTLGIDRRAYDGTNTPSVTLTGLTSGATLYVTAWMFTMEGTARPRYAKVTVP